MILITVEQKMESTMFRSSPEACRGLNGQQGFRSRGDGDVRGDIRVYKVERPKQCR